MLALMNTFLQFVPNHHVKTENFDLNSKNVKGCTLFHNAFIHEQEVVVNTTTNKNPLAIKLKIPIWTPTARVGHGQAEWVMGGLRLGHRGLLMVHIKNQQMHFYHLRVLDI